MAVDDPWWWSAGKTALAIRERHISAVELANIYVGRSKALSYLNALVLLRQEELIAEARRVDASSPDLQGVLAGVPFTVKDLVATAGTRTAAGSLVLADNEPRYDAPAVAALRNCGALLLGKSACPELGLSVLTESRLHGVTLNPWDTDKSPGGSSGGESALIAAGGSPLGIGTDFGGSLRWPAHCTGVFSLRPTPGVVPAAGQLPGAGGSSAVTSPALADPWCLQGSLQVVGPLARCVSDLELALGVLSDGGTRDLLGAGSPGMSRGRHWNRDVAIGWCAGDGATPVDDETSGLMETVAAHMGRDGYTVVHRPAALSGGHSCYNDLRDYDPLLNARALVAGKEDMIGDELRQALDRSSGPHPQPEAAVRERALLWRQEFISGLEETPVLLAPVAPTPAVGHDGRAVVSARELAKWELMAFCRAVSLTGAPVVTVPCCRSTAGLPMAVQVVGPPFGERMVLEVARYLEDTFGGFSPPPGVD